MPATPNEPVSATEAAVGEWPIGEEVQTASEVVTSHAVVVGAEMLLGAALAATTGRAHVLVVTGALPVWDHAEEASVAVGAAEVGAGKPRAKVMIGDKNETQIRACTLLKTLF